MKLFHLVIWRISLAFTVVLTLWAGFFYVAVMEEVNDEVDDSLEDYSERLILRALSGEEMPASNNGSNNQYYLYEVSPEYARSYPQITYRDEMVYIADKNETEPARVLITIFRADEDRYMELAVYVPTIEKLDLRRAILWWMVFLYFLLLLAILLVTVWVYRRNMKPLYTLLDWLGRYRLGHSNTPLANTTRITEFRRLNEAAISYANRSERLFEQQKLFIGNASHEMQTPLAICRNRLEMLMEDESLTEHQLEELGKVHCTLENLTRLNRSLLLLCKIENGQYMDRQTVCLEQLLERYLDDYREVYAYRDIQVSCSVTSRFCIEMNESLATVLVTNLLKNAFAHNVDGGRVRIDVTERSFTIANTGGPALDAEKIFERFYQGEKKEGSTGLGLALVETICKVSELSVRYCYNGSMHCFEITRMKYDNQ